VFFPAYNEEENVERIILQAQKVLPKVAEEWEIIPVNDGSRDRTGEIIERIAKEDPRVRPVHHIRNRGYGGAVISGFNASRFELIFFTDGDLQFDLHEIPLLLQRLNEGDLVLGYRKSRQDPFFRKVNAFLWGKLVGYLFGFRVRDVDCAFKIVKRSVLDEVELTSGGAMISTELLAKARQRNFRISEVGVTHYPRIMGSPTGSNLSVILRAFKELSRIYPAMYPKSRMSSLIRIIPKIKLRKSRKAAIMDTWANGNPPSPEPSRREAGETVSALTETAGV